MQQFLVAVITEDSRFAFMPPGASLKYFLSLRTSAVRGTSEEPFGNEMMLGCMGSTFDGISRIRVLGPIEPTAADGAGFGHFVIILIL